MGFENISIKNEASYLERMRKTFSDKAWFVPILRTRNKPCIHNIVDFGCADGSFIEYLDKKIPDSDEYDIGEFVGVETNPSFVNTCRKKDISVCTDIQDVKNFIDTDNTLVVLNSVLHEVAHYGSLAFLLYQIRSLGFRAIAIRDMKVGGGIWRYDADMERRFRALVGGIWMPGGVGQVVGRLRDFEKHWGSIADGYKAVHFLLKYFYEENWDREMQENYLSVDWRWLYGEIRNMGGSVTFWKEYSLPWLTKKWRNDFHDERLYDWFGLLKTHVKVFIEFPKEDV